MGTIDFSKPIISTLNTNMKLFIIAAVLIASVFAEPEAEADPNAWYASYGYAGFPYYGYGSGLAYAGAYAPYTYGAYGYAGYPYAAGYNGYALGAAHLIGKRSVDLFVTPNLKSKMIIGLINLKRLGWTTPAWPLDIERYQTLFQTPSTDDESDNEDIVNNIDDENTPAGASSDNSEKEKDMEKIDPEKEKDMEKIDQEDNDDDDEERPEGEICWGV